MCAILDANVVAQVFGDNRPSAGEEFFAWLVRRHGRLVVSSELKKELDRGHRRFRAWAVEAQAAGRLISAPEEDVIRKTEELRQAGSCRSNDAHIIALAQVTKARLLYTNDRDLHADFTDRRLINAPKGRIYTTRKYSDFRTSHRNLLSDTNICRPKR